MGPKTRESGEELHGMQTSLVTKSEFEQNANDTYSSNG